MADENMTEGSMSDDDVEIVPSAHNEQPVEVRTTEDILEYLQKKNPRIMPFMHKGRMCVKFQDFYMTVCNVKVGAAKMAKNRLIAKNPELCSRIIESLDAARGHPVPIISLEGAIELLLTMKSDLRGCMIKMAAKDTVGISAGTSEMLDRVQRHHDDPQREGLRASCENRDAAGEGRAFIGGTGAAGAAGDDVRMEEARIDDGIREVQKRLAHNTTASKCLDQTFEIYMGAVQRAVNFFSSDEESKRLTLMLKENARNATLLHMTALQNINRAGYSLTNTSPMIDNNGASAPSSAVAEPVSAPVVAQPPPPPPQMSNEYEPISVSVIMNQMGIRDDSNNTKAKAIGKKMASAYREKHGKEPETHPQFVNGQWIPVKSYTRMDLGMMEDAIREVCGYE